MEVQRADGVPGVDEVAEVADDLAGVEPPLEHLGPRAQRQRVQPGVGVVGVGDGLDGEQGAVGGGVDGGTGPVRRGPEHPLHDGQLVLLGGGPGDAVVHGHVPYEQYVEALLGDAAADECDGGVAPPPGVVGRVGRVGRVGAGRHEAVGDAEVPGAQFLAGDRAEELHRQVDAHAPAVADTLGGGAAAVRDGAERFVALADDVVVRCPVETGDEADATGAVLAGRVVQTEGGALQVRSSERIAAGGASQALKELGEDGQAASVKRSPRADRCDGRRPEWCEWER